MNPKLKIRTAAGWIQAGAQSLLLLALAGCSHSDVEVHKVARDDSAPAPMAQADMPAGHQDMGAGAVQPPFTSVTPEGWTQVPASDMRVASFKVSQAGQKADVSVVPLSGGGGGDLPNVNRWLGQVGQAPISDDELQKITETTQVSGQPARLFDLSGKDPSTGNPARILAAVQDRDGTTWFYKMTGDDALVEKQKPAFIAFLKSVNFGGAAPADLPPGHPPISDVGANVQMPAAAQDTTATMDGKPVWKVPAGWQDAPAGQFLAAKFKIAGDNGAQAAVNVSTSGGDGGGLFANVNRWRGQLGLAPISESDLSTQASTMDVSGGKASIVDLTGTDSQTGTPARLIAVVLPRAGQTWFYKMLGEETLVGRQKDAFLGFVTSAKY